MFNEVKHRMKQHPTVIKVESTCSFVARKCNCTISYAVIVIIRVLIFLNSINWVPAKAFVNFTVASLTQKERDINFHILSKVSDGRFQRDAFFN